MRVLLLQAREPTDPVLREERLAFASKAGLPVTSFVPYDLLQGPPAVAEVLAADALMVGGSGHYYVSRRDLPGFDGLMDMLRHVVSAGHPVFASCFGFQLMTVALGGEIVHDREGTEVGTYEVRLTDDGLRDELLGSLPPRFNAQLGRKDRASRLPAGVTHLASSERAPYQAMRVPGKPIWATQFHPELSVTENRARFYRYLSGYGAEGDISAQQEILRRFSESTATQPLIPRFLKLIER